MHSKVLEIKTDLEQVWTEGKTRHQMTTDGPMELKDVKSIFRCPLCNGVLCNPVQTLCGHQFCLSCITDFNDRGIDKSERIFDFKTMLFYCPIENVETKIFQDKCMAREINCISFYCEGRQNGCQFVGKISSLKVHMESCLLANKEQIQLPCPFAPNGCEFKGNEEEIRQHSDSSMGNHLYLVAKQCAKLQNTNKELEDRLEKESNRVQNLKTELQIKDRMVKEVQQNLENHNEVSTASQYQLQECIENVSGLTQVIVRLEDELQSQIDDIQKLKVNNSAIVEELEHTKTKPHTSSADVIVNDSPSKKLVCCREFNRLEVVVAKLSTELALQSSRIRDLTDTTHDGNFLWKIDNFTERFQEAVFGKNLSIFSNPFYTDQYGYKMRARIYLHGDGLGKGTHCSLFIVICKGEYDALLSWPFKRRVTFTLLSQDNGTDYSDYFMPNTDSSSFQRPRSERNVASGIPQFISHEQFLRKGFLRDDSFYVRVNVSES